MVDPSVPPPSATFSPRDPARLLAEVLDALPLGISLASRETGPIYVNRAAWNLEAPGDAPLRSFAGPEAGPDADGAEAGGRPVAILLGAGETAERRIEARIIESRHHRVAVGGAVFEVAVTRDVTEQRRLEEDLLGQVYFDELTGLPNRRLMERNVGELIARGPDEPFALAFVDVDNFKHINDYYGHDVGDGLLRKIARRIEGSIRGTDMLARVGGDEFVLLLTPVGSEAETAGDVDRLLHRLKEPFFIDGHEIFTSASIGVSLYPRHGATYEVLRVAADTAMYRIKSVAKGGAKFFDPNVGHAAAERMKLEQRLRLAIRDRRLCCAFQPKVDFREERIVGLEVLLRWRDEEGVIQAPGDFVALAVELGLMDEITLTVLAEVAEKIRWIDQTYGAETSISINIAARQAGDPRFMAEFVAAVVETGFAHRLMVELTEEAFILGSQFQSRILPMLRQIGVKVSIDDFGVGYSSLSALADITADEIKVDRSFVTDIHRRPRSQSILKAIESLATALGMSVIVEGVETFEELAYLQAATRIRLAQGFYFAKPQVIDDRPGRTSLLGNRETARSRPRLEMRQRSGRR